VFLTVAYKSVKTGQAKCANCAEPFKIDLRVYLRRGCGDVPKVITDFLYRKSFG
jgi:hypothetical protein